MVRPAKGDLIEGTQGVGVCWEIQAAAVCSLPGELACTSALKAQWLVTGALSERCFLQGGWLASVLANKQSVSECYCRARLKEKKEKLKLGYSRRVGRVKDMWPFHIGLGSRVLLVR